MAVDKLVDSTQLDADLTSVANAIRTKGGTSADLAFPAGFVSAVQAIPTGITPTGTKQISIASNGTTTEDVTNYANVEITVAVPSQSGYTAADFADRAKPTGEVTVETAVTSNASAQQYSLHRRTGITKLNLPNFTYIPTYYSTYLTSCTEINAPKAVTIGENSLRNNTAMVYAIYPKAREILANAFQANTALLRADFGGNATASNSQGFYRGNIFNGCTKLNFLVIRSTTRFYLYSTNVFTGTPFASGGAGGTLYVPQSLVSSYQSATSWTTILGYSTNQIKSIESTATDPDAPVDLTTHYADGTLISTT